MSLKELRKKAGLRQADVADKLGVVQSAVSKWETCETRPSTKYHRQLAQIYGCSVDTIKLNVSKEERA